MKKRKPFKKTFGKKGKIDLKKGSVIAVYTDEGHFSKVKVKLNNIILDEVILDRLSSIGFYLNRAKGCVQRSLYESALENIKEAIKVAKVLQKDLVRYRK